MRKRTVLNTTATALVGIAFAFSMTGIAFADTNTGEVSQNATVTTRSEGGLGGVVDRLKALRDGNTASKGTLTDLMNRPKITTTTPVARPCTVMLPGDASTTGSNGNADEMNKWRNGTSVPCGQQGGMGMSTSTREKWMEQASSTRARIQGYIDNLKKATDTARQKEQDRMKEIKKHVNDSAYKAIESMMNRLTDSYDKLSALLGTAATTLTTAAGTGVDVSAADAKIKTAQADLLDAQTAIVAAQTKLSTIVAASTTPTGFQDIRTSVQAAVDKLKTASTASFDAFKATKEVTGVNVNWNSDASSTNSH